jgi:ribosomal subunit interface protein
MELTISAKNLTVSDRFREYVAEKSQKIERFSSKSEELNIKVTRYEHRRSSGVEDQVELTVYKPGHVVRAEAKASDKFVAFDIALGKLLERMRRYSDKQKVHIGGNHKNISTSELAATDFAEIDLRPADLRLISGEIEVIKDPEGPDYGVSPVVIRTKEFEKVAMTREEAIDRMELVGHDFYLFHDSKIDQAAVVYRRQGWSYGVISLS